MSNIAVSAIGLISAGLLWLSLQTEAGEPQTNARPPFAEVYGLVSSNFPGLDKRQLDQTLTEALLRQFRSQVQLVSSNGPAGPTEPAPENPIGKATLYDDFYGYLRLLDMTPGLAERAVAEIARLNATNKLKGLILDLRFARGTDMRAAAEVADLFIAEDKNLLSSGPEVFRARAKTNAITIPVTILINPETSGSAEVLAAVMRDAEVGLLIGTPTSGKAGTFRNFPLSNGQWLRIAIGGIKLGSGRDLSGHGLTPDILIEVSPEAEKAYWEDAFKTSSSAARTDSTNAAERVFPGGRRMNEAELVRRQREGQADSEGPPPRARGFREIRPLVTDPALARALDLLKGLALVQDSRAN